MASNIVEVTPTGSEDSLVLQYALEKCRLNHATRLVFRPGTYHFHEGSIPAHPQVVLFLHRMENLEIDGSGSEFLFTGQIGFLEMHECSNITIRNMTVDWERPPFSVGKVLSSTPTSFEIEVFEEFPVKGDEPIGAFMDFDPDTHLQRRPAVDAYNAVKAVSLLRPQVLKVDLLRKFPMQPGVLAVLRHSVYGRVTFYAGRCRNIQFEDITVYASPSMTLIGEQTDNITLLRYKVLNKPGTRRLMSATADATHFGGCTGLIRIQDCVFEGMGDDAVNIKTGLYLSVLNKEDEHTLLGEHNLKMACAPSVGDAMEFCHVDTMIPYATLKVDKVETIQPDPAKAEFRYRVTFQEKLPDEVKTTDVVGNISRLVKVHISGCRVHANRPRGFLIQTRDALIENNIFDSSTSSGVLVITDVTHFFESISAHNVVIRDNTFVNTDMSLIHGGAITILCWRKDWTFPPSPGVFRNITIENNVITNSGECGILATNVDGLVIRNNRIEGVCQTPGRPNGSSGISLVACRSAIIEGNELLPDKQGKGFKRALELGPGCEEKSIYINGNQGF